MQTTPSENISRQSNHLSARPEGALASARTVNCTLDPQGRLLPKGTQELSTNTFGRTQLAQMYFPYIQPQTAWQKLRGLLATDPALVHLTKLKRRTFLPAEVNIIYQHLGQP